MSWFRRGDRAANSITRADVHAVVNSIIAREANVQANRVLSLISAIFTFALNCSIDYGVTANPCTGFKRNDNFVETERGRALSDDEIKIHAGRYQGSRSTPRRLRRRVPPRASARLSSA